MTHQPTTEVVIPGHNAARTLEPCLQALMPLLTSGVIKRVVFVDDHSTDETPHILRRYPVQVMSSTRRGAGAARNAGWRATQSDCVWFVDADCVAQLDTLARLHQTMSELGASAVGGSYSNKSPGKIVADLIHEEMVTRHRAMGRDVTFAITANLLCRRQALEAMGGFDESLRLGQDLDFTYRLVASGYRIGFDTASVVGHFHETNLWKYLHKQGRQGFWRMHIYRRHPTRMIGDSYSGPLDYVQPPLALVACTAPSAGLLCGAPAIGGIVAALAIAALAACQLPLARTLVTQTGSARYWNYVPFGAARAAFRGVGMALGIASVAIRESPEVSSEVSMNPRTRSSAL